MNETEVKRLGLILAIQAEIEGIKATNQHTMACDNYICYDEHHFYEKAEELRELCYKHPDQL